MKVIDRRTQKGSTEIKLNCGDVLVLKGASTGNLYRYLIVENIGLKLLNLSDCNISCLSHDLARDNFKVAIGKKIYKDFFEVVDVIDSHRVAITFE